MNGTNTFFQLQQFLLHSNYILTSSSLENLNVSNPKGRMRLWILRCGKWRTAYILHERDWIELIKC